MLLNVTLLSYHSGKYLRKSCFRELHLFFLLKQQTCRAAQTSLWHLILAICLHYIPSFISYFLWLVVTVLIQTIVLPLCHCFVFIIYSSAPISKVKDSVWTTDCRAQQNPSLIPSQAREIIPQGSNWECSFESQWVWREQMQDEYMIKASWREACKHVY